MKNDIAKMTGKPVNTIQLDIMEIKHPDTNAQLVAENIAQQLEKRISFRRAMKQTIGRAMKAGAKGIKTRSPAVWAARTSPAARATTRVPSRCRRCAPTSTTALPRPRPPMGRIGVKVWIYKGQVLPKAKRAPAAAAPRRSEGGK